MTNNNFQSVSSDKEDLKVENREQETKKTFQSGEKFTSLYRAYPAHKGEQLELLYKIAILGIIIAIIMLAFDLWRDESLHVRITELERQIANYKIQMSEEIIKQQKQINHIENELEKLRIRNPKLK